MLTKYIYIHIENVTLYIFICHEFLSFHLYWSLDKN